MVVFPTVEAVAADAIALFRALVFTEAAKFTTAVLAADAVAALVAATTLVAAALAAAVTAAATPPTFVGVAVLVVVFLLLELLEDSGEELEVLVEEPLELELLEPELLPDDVPLVVEEEPVPVVLVDVLDLEVVLEPVLVVLELDDPFALTGPAKTIPLASMLTLPVLPPVEDAEPFTVMACAVAVI
jgi:hypothetical protein